MTTRRDPMVTSTLPDASSIDGTHLRVGEVLAGKYRIDRLLGVGGMGVVLAATHLMLRQRVAIKLLLPESLENEIVVARFEREARAAAALRSEHVARVIDVGRLDNGAPFMVMELLDGGDLEAVVERNGPLAIDVAVNYVLQACEAIAEAHSLGIVHRDLKPQNLFLTQRVDGSPLVKVLDFGISKTPNDANDKALTRSRDVMGSPLYMSPEQMRSVRDVDARSDLWALGAILYRLIAGRTPFDGETMAELCARVLMEDYPPLRASRPDVPDGLVKVIDRCLRKNASERFATIADLARALDPFASHHSVRAAQRVVAASNRPPPLTPADPTMAASSPNGSTTNVPVLAATGSSRRKGPGWIVALAVLAVTGAGAGVAVWRTKGSSSLAPAPSQVASIPATSTASATPLADAGTTPAAAVPAPPGSTASSAAALAPSVPRVPAKKAPTRKKTTPEANDDAPDLRK